MHTSDAEGTPGEEVGQSINTGDAAETVTVRDASGFYLAYANYYDTTGGGSYKGTATLAVDTPAEPDPVPTPTPAGGGGGGGVGTAPSGDTLPPAGPLQAEVAMERAKLAAVRKSGVPVRIGCTVQCRASLKVTVDKRTARKLKLGRQRTIGQASTTVMRKEHATTVKLTSKARKRLKKAKRVKLRLAAVVTDNSGAQRKTARTSATYKR